MKSISCICLISLMCYFLPTINLPAASIPAANVPESSGIFNVSELEEDLDYVPGEILVSVNSLEEAETAAIGYGAEVKEYYEHGLAVLTLPDDAMVKKSILLGSAQISAQNSALPKASPNYINRGYGDISGYLPNDPFITSQSYHSQLMSYHAWAINKGDPDVLVAVIDTGIDTDHPEFAGRISHLAYNAYTNKIGIGHVYDEIGHGTLVAGVIAAAQDNGSGGSGIAPGVTILPIKANDPSYKNMVFQTVHLVNAIYYAADNGADIINISLGRSYDHRGLTVEKDAIDYAVSKGAIVVCAAGNEGDDHASYPAAYENAIAVSALGADGKLLPESNHGPEVDVCAPGSKIFSAISGEKFETVSGTSFSAAMVAGAAALVLSENPELTVAQVTELIYQKAIDMGDPGFDNEFGNGLLRLPELLDSVREFIYFNGSGTEQSPYLIENTLQVVEAAGLCNINALNNRNMRYELISDIDISRAGNWHPFDLGTEGVFDGGGFALDQLTIRRNTTIPQSTFGFAGRNYGEIRDLRMTNINIWVDTEQDSSIGGIVARNTESGRIIDCSVSGELTVNPYILLSNHQTSAGSICGESSGTISGCSSSVDIFTNSSAGGIAGRVFGGILSGCTNTGDISGHAQNVGGIAGYSYGKIADSYNSGNISGASVVGGIAGKTQINFDKPEALQPRGIDRCGNSGDISVGGDYAGGICGSAYHIIKDCYNTGYISGSGTYYGGIFGIGHLPAEIVCERSYNSVSVTGGSGIGFGAIGGKIEPDSSLKDCFDCDPAEIYAAEFFTNFDFANVWIMPEGVSHTPLLRSSYVPLTQCDLPDITVFAGKVSFIRNEARPEATIREVIYSGYDPSLISIDPRGRITGLKPGTTILTGTSVSGGSTDSCTVTVKESVRQITLSPDFSMNTGTQAAVGIQITAEPGADTRIKWTSSDTSIATVDATGNIICHRPGTVRIIAKAADGSGAYATCIVTGIRPVRDMIIRPHPDKLFEGETHTFGVIVIPVDASIKAVTWSCISTYNKISEAGLFRAVNDGVQKITVRSNDGMVTRSTNITVLQPVESIRLNCDSLKLRIRQEQKIIAEPFPVHAYDRKLTWSSSESNIVSVDQNGVVLAKQYGSATIYASATDGSGVVKSCSVSVLAYQEGVNLTDIPVNLNRGSSYTIGTFINVPERFEGLEDEHDELVEWISSDPAIASVSSGGVVTGLQDGYVKITATYLPTGQFDERWIKIIEPVTEVRLSTEHIDIGIGKKIRITGSLYPSNSFYRSVIWSSGDTDIVKIDANGDILAYSAGETLITGSSPDGLCKTYCTVTSGVAAKSITITGGDAFYLGRSTKFYAEVFPTDAIARKVSWSSEYKFGSTRTTIDQDGVFTPQFVGEWDIIAQALDGSGVTARKTVYVADPTVCVSFLGYSLGALNIFLQIGDKVSQPEDPEREGKIFDGWFKDAECTIPFDFDTEILSGSITIYSGWKDPILRLTSNVYHVDESKSYVSGIACSTMVSVLLYNINESSYAGIYDNTQEVNGSTLAATGMELRLAAGGIAARSYIIIVSGDINGDGKVSLTDFVQLKSHILAKSTLAGAFAIAADLNGDDKITLTDFVRTKAYLLGK